MVGTYVMTTETDVLSKIGDGVSPDFTDAMKTAAGLRAENKVNSTIRFNFSDVYATLNIDVKYLISDIVSSLIAIEGIKYDMGGYTTRTEAEDMVNIERDSWQFNMSVLRDKKVEDFINAA